MGYQLRALLSRQEVLEILQNSFNSLKVVPLVQGFGLIPITHELYDEIQSIEKVPQSNEFEGFYFLSPAIAKLAGDLSLQVAVAYLEADFFGGVGTQSAVVLERGNLKLKQPPIESKDVINQALRLLGVQASESKDEFDTIDLGQQRFTEDW